MSVKQILADFKQTEEMQEQRRQLQAQAEKQVEARLEKMAICFETVILPVIHEVERDLQSFRFWYKIDLSQATSPSTSRHDIREAVFRFYPEKFQTAYHSQRVFDASYGAFFRGSGDFRKIQFLLQLPRRLPQSLEMEEAVHRIEDIDRATVSAFMEKFIKGAIAAYQSDRVLL